MVELLRLYSNLGLRQRNAVERASRLMAMAPATMTVTMGGASGKQRQRQRRLTAEERQEVVSLYLEEVTTNEIARRFGVHKDTVRAVVDEAGARRKKRHQLTPADLREAQRLRSSGASYATLGQQFGVGAETIRHRLLG